MADKVNSTSFELSPIEQNAPRRYKRIAMVLPLSLSDSSVGQQTDSVKQSVTRAFLRTLQTWPVLAGKISTSTTNATKLALIYPEVHDWEKYWNTRPDLVEFQMPGKDDSEVKEQAPRVRKGLLNDTFFACDKSLTLEKGLPLVTLKLSIFNNDLILGFALYEILFDGEFLTRFFHQFNDMTSATGGSTLSYTTRSLLDVEGDFDKGKLQLYDLFPCYDWSNKAVEGRTPRDKLACRLLVFDRRIMLKLMHGIHTARNDFNYETCVETQDCLAGMLWVVIMRARFQNKRVTTLDKARLNILLPGEAQAREVEEYDESYFGNSTVATLAKYTVQDLISAPDNANHDLHNRCDFEELAVAANAIRKAIHLVDYDYMEDLVKLKETHSPVDDWAAYERALNRSSNGLVLEDWACYSAGDQTGIPHADEDEDRPHLLPGEEDMEEGKMILLPRRGGHEIAGTEAGWAVWLCLAQAEMDIVVRQLVVEGW